MASSAPNEAFCSAPMRWIKRGQSLEQADSLFTWIGGDTPQDTVTVTAIATATTTGTTTTIKQQSTKAN